MKSHFHFKEYEVPYYRSVLIVVLTNDYERLSEFYPEYDHEDMFASSDLINYHGTRSILMVLNFKCDVDRITNGIIAHEALHAANFIFDAVGVPADYDNDEPLAYLVKWITDKVHGFVSEKGFKVAVEEVDLLKEIGMRKKVKNK